MEELRMMQDNKHYQAAKIDGFWDFVTRDPGDYVARHSTLNSRRHGKGIISMGCSICVAQLENKVATRT